MVFMAVGEYIGLGTTLLLALLTAIIGGAIIKHQGLQVLASLQNNMRAGGMPVQEIFDGACLIAAGATLITPGFVTDTIGFLLLIPTVRSGLRHVLSKHINVSGGFSSTQQYSNPDILDGEYEDLSGENDNSGANDPPRLDKS